MGCPRTVYVFLLLSSYFVLAEAGRGRQALEQMKKRQAQARKSMEERVQRANRQRPNNGKPRKKTMEQVAAAASATANVAAAAAFDGAFTAEEATVPAAVPSATAPSAGVTRPPRPTAAPLAGGIKIVDMADSHSF